MNIVEIAALLCLSGSAFAQEPVDAERAWETQGFEVTTPLRALPDEARADFRLITAGNVLVLTSTGIASVSPALTAAAYLGGGGATLVVPAVPMVIGYTIGTPLIMAGQARSLKRLKARGIHVRRTGFIAGAITSGVAFGGASASLGMGLSSSGLTPAVTVFAISSAVLHGVSLIPFLAQSRAIRRAWTVEMARGSQVDEPVSVGGSVFVSPTIDPIGRRVGLTVVW